MTGCVYHCGKRAPTQRIVDGAADEALRGGFFLGLFGRFVFSLLSGSVLCRFLRHGLLSGSVSKITIVENESRRSLFWREYGVYLFYHTKTKTMWRVAKATNATGLIRIASGKVYMQPMRGDPAGVLRGAGVMKKVLLGTVGLFALSIAAQPGFAADMPVKAVAAPAPAWSWEGFYVGGYIGSAMGLNNIADPLGVSIFGDLVHSPGYFGGVEAGFNWQTPGSNLVLGVEADLSLGNLDGTNTCYAFSGTFTSFNCRAHTDWFGTFTGRAGWAFGPFGRSLVYAKGGLAWAHSNVDMIINNNLFGVAGTSTTSFNSVGWTVGIGAEYAMTAHWTVKAEYDYLDLGRSSVTAPSPSAITVPNAAVPAVGVFVAVPGTTVSQQIHAFKLGVNYKFGPDGAPFPPGFGWPLGSSVSTTPVKTMPVKAPPIVAAAGWEMEFGARYWYSKGRFQKDIAPGNIGAQNPTLNISRLTWDNLTGNSGEAFGRIDTPWNFFAKGFVGGGSISGGKINDEDWGIAAPFAAVNTGYSNTVGNASGNLKYATIDGGFDVFRGPGYKVGPFVGYNYYADSKSSFTCTQIALPASGICNPTFNGFILGENDKWNSLRVGGSADVMLLPQLKMAADVAFVPYTKFDGQDNHPLRPFLANEWGTGIGTQAELMLSYYLTPQFSLGAGGRYWAMWTTSGGDCRLPPNGACPAPLQNVQYKTERYGVLLQASYKWDQPGTVVAKY